jgi:hypothetical protein
MHQHLHPHVIRLVRPRPAQTQRPAKVIVLETRRKARLQKMRTERQPPRDAA